MTAVYRFYTEDNANLLDIVARYFDSASLSHVDGMWQGNREHGAIIEVVTEDNASNRLQVHTLATRICLTNAQSEVMIVVQSARGLEQLHITPLSAVVVS